MGVPTSGKRRISRFHHRANQLGPADARGVIAHACSTDFLTWEVLPPITVPGDFGVMEVPQLVDIRGRYYLIFSVYSAVCAAHRERRTGLPPMTGTHYWVADDPLGPFRANSDAFWVGDSVGKLYSGKLVQDFGGNW